MRNLYTTLTNFSTKYLMVCNVYTDVRAKARGLSPRTGGQTMVNYYVFREMQQTI